MKKELKYMSLGGAGVAISLLVWGVAIEPYRVDVQMCTAAIPGLPRVWEGQEVAVVADFQIGMWMGNTATVRRVISMLVERQPALVLMLGDFVYRGGDALKVEGCLGTLRDLIRPLCDSGIPSYAVLGNHDYGVRSTGSNQDFRRAERVRAVLEESGVHILQNEAIPLPAPGSEEKATNQEAEAPLYLVGLGAHMPGQDRAQRSLARLPASAPRLVVMHNPSSFAAVPAHTAPLAIAAHTHGGQFRIPFTPSWSWLSFLGEDEVHVDGWIRDYGQAGNRLYVNRGIGFSLLPVRFNAPPEITIFTLEPPNN